MAQKHTKAPLERMLQSARDDYAEADKDRMRLRGLLDDTRSELESSKRHITEVSIQNRELRAELTASKNDGDVLRMRVRDLENAAGRRDTDKSELVGQVKALSVVLDQIRVSLDLE